MKHQFLLLCVLVIFFSVAMVEIGSDPVQDDTQPITTIMQRLMMDMQTIEVGIWNENYETIWSGAHNILNHPKIPADQRTEIAGILGKQKMKAFAALDMQVHNQADSLAKDALAQNMNEILKHYSIIQQGCVSCHSNFRTEIIEGR
ncbi:hypothetical protein [Halalkalibaculum sp. DA384]|uniref:hypothetical protein n=1 Tax=Halalkalibaculum sp. DA384 TaxID=3373606 RepID=UPI003754B9BA